MGTRGMIARRRGDGFEGAYHHWDSYPEGLGATLHRELVGLSVEELRKKLDFLLSHSWSTVCADWTKAPGFDGDGPECYCHGSRSEGHRLISVEDAAPCGVEYVYLIEPEERRIRILSSFRADGSKMVGAFGCGDPDASWGEIGVIDLTDATEPEFARMG